MKYLTKFKWAIWLIGVIFAFWLFINSSLNGISLLGIFVGAVYLLPILLIAIINKTFDHRRQSKDPNQNLKDYNIIDFCFLILVVVSEFATIAGIVYILYQHIKA